jgi:uncharacterized protein
LFERPAAQFMAPNPEPLFIRVAPGPLGQRFALHHAPHAGPARGLVVYVHPFAEEMNKSRRMAAMQSRALAAAGFAVLQMDLLGCGDSGGDFGDATWPQWVDDVAHACRSLRLQYMPSPGQTAAPLWLWGLRVGCLLATDAAATLGEACNFLFWQPTTLGSAALQQFLRLKLASEMLSSGATGATAALRRQLAEGQAAEIAGYMLNPLLASGLDSASLSPPPIGANAVAWLEVRTSVDSGLSPASTRTIERWKQAGFLVKEQVVIGPAFWQSTEIEDVPGLIGSTVSALLGQSPLPDVPCAVQGLSDNTTETTVA